ncbi:MAG: hypothetical protein R3C02_18995 [Planctomycetaceae bacterium]
MTVPIEPSETGVEVPFHQQCDALFEDVRNLIRLSSELKAKADELEEVSNYTENYGSR